MFGGVEGVGYRAFYEGTGDVVWDDHEILFGLAGGLDYGGDGLRTAIE